MRLVGGGGDGPWRLSAWISSALDDGAAVPVPREEAVPAKILLRLPHTLHQDLRRAAGREGISLNQYLLICLPRGSTPRFQPAVKAAKDKNAQPQPSLL